MFSFFLEHRHLFTSGFTFLKVERQGQCFAQGSNADQESHFVIALGLPLAEGIIFS
jgi:hypothetical protein